MDEVETYSTFKLAGFIDTYWFPVLVPIGLVGNTLSFLVMMKSNNRKMSTCIYMAAMSINDNLMMLMCFHDYFVSTLQIHKWHPLECKCAGFVALFALQNGTFHVVAMTLDKYIAIKWPHKAATYSTPRRAKVIALGLYVSASVYNIPHFFLSSVIGGHCFNFGVRSMITTVYSWLSFVINAVIPFTVLIYMNLVIVKAVRKSRKMFGRPNNEISSRGSNQGTVTSQKTKKHAENQVTIMLLLVTTLFLIYFVHLFEIYLFGICDTRHFHRICLVHVAFSNTAKLYNTNSGINFFLYCISGRKFRNDLKEILCSHSHSHPSLFKSKEDL